MDRALSMMLDTAKWHVRSGNEAISNVSRAYHFNAAWAITTLAIKYAGSSAHAHVLLGWMHEDLIAELQSGEVGKEETGRAA
jgi:hypothetical protein